MAKPILGIQIHTVRNHFFNEDALKTLKDLKALGYEAVEFVSEVMNKFTAPELKAMLDEAGLICSSTTLSWNDVSPENIEKAMEYFGHIGCKNLVAGGAAPNDLKSRTKIKEIIKALNESNEIAKKAGFTLGYHAHAADFFMVDGVSSWDRIMQGTPQDFNMIIDTGNMLYMRAESEHYINKYPGRTPIFHAKPFDKRISSGAVMFNEDSFNWPALIDLAITKGGMKYLIAEYSNKNRFTPMEAAKLCCDQLKEILEKYN